MIAALWGAFLLLLLLGVPFAVALGWSAGIYLRAKELPLFTGPHVMTSAVDSFTLLAIPFFILAGNLMNVSTISQRIFAFAAALVGHIPGGLAHVNVLNSVVVSGMTGSAIADASGMGNVEIQAMKREGFPAPFAAAVTAASATMGPIIPPSIPMVIYGVTAETSIGRLFLGGLIPGIIMALSMMILIYIMARRDRFPVAHRAGLSIILRRLIEALPCILAPLVIIGSIALGIAGPTEASVVAVGYMLFLGLVVYRDLDRKKIWQAVLDTVETTGQVLFVVAAASLFGWAVTREGMAESLLLWSQELTSKPWLLLLAINAILLIMGMFMETLSILLIAIPALLPLVKAAGIDLVHFGVVAVLNVMVGLLTPPFGMGVLVASRLAGVQVEETFRAVLPFLVPLLVTVMLITYVPQLVTWLPNKLMP